MSRVRVDVLDKKVCVDCGHILYIILGTLISFKEVVFIPLIYY